jgi:putative hydrolase of the HAD superfamily
MFDLTKIKGIIFDYGGTIDSNGKHWSEVLWESYQDNKIPVTKEQFRDAYVFAERYLATNPVIQPDDNFHILLKKKAGLQITYLTEKGFLKEENKTKAFSIAVSDQCYTFVKDLIKKEIDILNTLGNRYPMALVSNFYGNVQAVLDDFGLLGYFNDIIESAVVGLRKPNPAIFGLGVEKLGLPSSSVVVIGDSYAKDIVPAAKNGCKTIWLKGIGWNEEDKDATADIIIKDFMELKSVFQLKEILG